MLTNVYVDSFNLYFGALKNTPYKWLDIRALASLLYPNDTINEVRVFSANVNATIADPKLPVRQQIYFRALATTGVSIHLGQFTTHDEWIPLANEFAPGSVPTWTVGSNPKPASTDPVIGIMPDGKQHARVRVTREKGTDVTLGAYLLIDAFEQKCEQAVIVSNDSDLVVPVSYVNSTLGIPVHILHPCRSSSVLNPNVARGAVLRGAASGWKNVDTASLAACQLPDPLSDAKGIIHKPTMW